MTKETTMTPPDGFVPHDGGECPVADEAIVDVIFADSVAYYRNKASTWVWPSVYFGDRSADLRIIAYRIENTA